MRRFNRRTALRAAATGAAGLATTAALAGCGETEVVEVEKVVTVQVAGETQIVEVEIPGEATVTERVVTIEVPVAAPAPVTQVTNIWFNQATQQENFEKNVVGHYHRQQDAFKLDPILVPNNELNVKLTAAIASGTPPDVVRVGGPILMNNFFRRGVMHDMGPVRPGDPEQGLRPLNHPGAELARQDVGDAGQFRHDVALLQRRPLPCRRAGPRRPAGQYRRALRERLTGAFDRRRGHRHGVRHQTNRDYRRDLDRVVDALRRPTPLPPTAPRRCSIRPNMPITGVGSSDSSTPARYSSSPPTRRV